MKKLYRSLDRKLAGVCGGIAEYLEVDPTVVRILYLILTLFTVAFPGILLYIILWIMIPDRQ